MCNHTDDEHANYFGKLSDSVVELGAAAVIIVYPAPDGTTWSVTSSGDDRLLEPELAALMHQWADATAAAIAEHGPAPLEER